MTFPYEWTIARQSSPILPIYVGLLVLFSLFLGRIVMHDIRYRLQGGPKAGPQTHDHNYVKTKPIKKLSLEETADQTFFRSDTYTVVLFLSVSVLKQGYTRLNETRRSFKRRVFFSFKRIAN